MLVKWLGLSAVLSLLLIAGISFADGYNDNDQDHDDAPLKITMDQTKLIHLKQDAADVIVDNPGHVSVALDNPRLLIVTPHNPGVTSMTVLDSGGETIMRRDIIVTNVQQNYVRVRRMCNGSDPTCSATSYAYCPDGCYEVTAVPDSASGGTGSVPPPTAGPPGLIGGEPAQTLLGPADDCPAGFNKAFVPGVKTGDQHYTCQKR